LVGKTVITLTAILALKKEIGKVLVVAPLRVARDSWPAEIEKWDHTKGLRYAVAVGTERERIAALNSDADIYIINRENLEWMVNKCRKQFSMLVLDELSSFKNRQAKRFKAVMNLRLGAERVVGLTGTPSSNGLMDLWAEFKVLDFGKRLGRFITQYRLKYFLPDKRNANVIYTYKLQEGAEERIYKAISDITISMRSCDYLKMPELISNTYMVRMSEKEKEVYDTMKKDLVFQIEGETITASNAAALCGKLGQMANGCIYKDDGYSVIHNHKLDALEDIIESMNGKPVMVCYWYKHDLECIVERLRKLKLKFSVINTSESIKAWNNRELDVGLIQPSSAGHGLNLQNGGSVMVWYSLTWSLELQQQCICRLYRQGQTDKTVVVQYIVTEGTVDENIMMALKNKESTQDRLIDAVKAQLEVK